MPCFSRLNLQVSQHGPSSCEEEEEAIIYPVVKCAVATRGLASTRQPNLFGLALRRRRGCRSRGNRGGVDATVPADIADIAVIRLRGGDASQSSPSSSSSRGIKGVGTKEKEDASAPWALNFNVFGWGGDSEAEAEAKAEKKRKAKQDMEEAEAREAMRKAREER